MTYATSTMVKSRCKISGSTRDEELTAAITYGDSQADSFIQIAGGSTPVSSPPETLKQAAADFAAFYFYRIDNPTKAALFWESGKTLIKGYIAKNVTTSGAGRSGKRGIRDDDE